MKRDLRYLNNVKFFDYAFDVFQRYFTNREAFKTFFNAIRSEEEKDKLLQVACFYKFLVKEGNFVFDNPALRPVVDYYIDYIDETYKYIAIFALIERLLGKSDFVEFYNWLLQNHDFSETPITSKNKLRNLYAKYLKEFGATQKAITFFSSLDPDSKQLIEAKVNIRDGSSSSSLEVLAELLYEMRSEFVHKAKLVLEVGKSTVISTRNEKKIVTKLTVQDLCKLFERGVLLYFGYSSSLPPLSEK
jgi:hypothetical protein